MARPKRSPLERGYGAEHRRLRDALAPVVAAGEAVCARCHLRIAPGAPWDLGHSDDRRSWTGPEHRSCNRRAGAVTRNRRRAGDRLGVPSRRW